MFYEDDGRISDHKPMWVQTMLTVVVQIFERVGLQMKLGKTKGMVFTPGFIWGQLGVAAYKRRATGEGDTFRERKKTRVSCKECVTTMAELLLLHHMERSNGIVIPHNRGVEFGRGVPETYVVSFPLVLNLVACAADG